MLRDAEHGGSDCEAESALRWPSALSQVSHSIGEANAWFSDGRRAVPPPNEDAVRVDHWRFVTSVVCPKKAGVKVTEFPQKT